MSITGIVENGVVKLPPGTHLPEGTRVSIEPESVSPTLAPKADSTPESGPHAEPETLYDLMKDFIGCIKDGPRDLAAEHDHYAHGTPKRGKA